MKSVMLAFLLMVFVVLGSTRLGSVVAAQANPAADGEPPRKILWQIGQLDGLSDHAGSPIAEAFRKETVAGALVRISVDRVREDFPRRIPPGQTIVLDLPELEMTDLLFRADTVTELKPDDLWSNDVPSLRILFNGKPIWTRRLYLESHMVTALIPASYLAPHNNTITLQSDGEKDVIIENAWIETACAFRVPVHFYIHDWAKIPDAYRGDYRWNRDPMTEARPLRVHMHQKGDRSQWHTERRIRTNFVGFNEQERVARQFLDDTLEWYFNGGRSIRIKGMVGLGHLFCAYTKRPYPSAYALWTATRPFEGAAVSRLPVNVLAGDGGGRGKTPGLVYWMATENSPGVASIIIGSHRYYGHIPGEKVRVVCALPWQGAAVAHVYNGIFPEDVFMDIPTGRGGRRKNKDPYKPYDRNRVDSVIDVQVAPNGQGGLLDVELDMQNYLLIRLVKEGADPVGAPEQVQYNESHQDAPPPFTSFDGAVVVSVSGSHEDRDRLIKHFPIYEGVIKYLSPNYRERIGKATHGHSDAVVEGVPEVEQSLFVDIDYTFGVPLTAEGVALRLSALFEKIAGRVLSFWVYPHAKTGGDLVPLRMGLGAWEGRVMLQPEKWQRVELHFANIASLPTNHLVLLGPASDDSARRIKAVTFELNGIKLLDGPAEGD